MEVVQNITKEEIKKLIVETLYTEENIRILERMLNLENVRSIAQSYPEFKQNIKEEVDTKVSRDELTQAINGLKDLVLMLRDEMNRRFEQVDKRFEQVDKRFEDMNKHLDRMFKFMGLGFSLLAILIGLMKILG